MRRRGEITLFLAMILLSVCALLCVTAESARTAGARCFLRMAADSSMDSLMAQYHRGLWESYRLLGLEHRGGGMLEAELEEFLKPYMEAENWYPMEVRETEAVQLRLLTEGDGDYLEQEILDYMRYGLAGMVWDELGEGEAKELLEAFREAGSVSKVSGLYESHTREAVRLEKAIEAVQECLLSQEDHWKEGEEALRELDGGRFIKEAEMVIEALKKIPGRVDTYEKRADQLAGKLAESRERFESLTDLSDSARAALEEEIRLYESYVEEDGARRAEIAALRESSAEQILFVEAMIEEAEAVIEYIDSWEPADEDDELDEEELWRPVRRKWEERSRLALAAAFGVKDQEKEGWLERVKDIVGSSLLELVLPEGVTASEKKPELSGAPSAGYRPGGGTEGWKGGVETLLERLLVCEYGVRFFDGFDREGGEEDYYELEYILQGKKRDRENLAGTVSALVALREGMNLLHILSDAGKRQEARGLAMAIAGSTGVLLLVPVLTFFIMSVWALGEAVTDVRRLLEGGRVPFVKTAQDWRMSLEQLLDMGRSGGLFLGAGAQGEERGLNYLGYLRILLFGGYGEMTVYRMMDMMQMNIRRKEEGFLLEDCACAVDMELTVCGKHVFFSPGLWKSGGERTVYETRMAVSGSYMGDL